MNDKSKDDSFLLFKVSAITDLTKLPEIIPLSSFNSEKHTKLCKDAIGTVPPAGLAEINDVPNFLSNLPPPESLQQLLDRIKSKVVGPVAEIPRHPDLNNESMNEFLERMNARIFPIPDIPDASPEAPSSVTTTVQQTSSSAPLFFSAFSWHTKNRLIS
jgi:hypothetical protein